MSGLGAGGTWLYQLNATRECNLRCAHCYISSDVKRASGRMRIEDLRSIASGIAEHLDGLPGTTGELHVIGGEPTMLGFEWHEEAVAALRSSLTGRQHRLVLVSNLVSASPDETIRIAGLYDRVATSWEPSTRFSKPRQEEAWIGAVRRLREAGIVPSVTTALARPTVEAGASSILSRLRDDFGFLHVHLGFFVPEGDGLAGGDAMFPSFAATADFLIEAAEWYVARRDADPELYVNPIEGVLDALASGERSDDVVCPMISGSMDVDWDGSAAACLEVGGGSSPAWAGNVLRDGVAATAASPAFSKARLAAMRLRRECASCPERGVCEGACGVLQSRWDGTGEDCPGFRRFLRRVREFREAGVQPRSERARTGCR
jgi:radical SAM protein with 4Fe4S-binding SPASM domain